MSRLLYAVEIQEKQLKAMYKARLIASAVLITLFTALVAFTPRTDPSADPAPAMTAAVTGHTQE
jgi:hypothetical protein